MEKRKVYYKRDFVYPSQLIFNQLNADRKAGIMSDPEYWHYKHEFGIDFDMDPRDFHDVFADDPDYNSLMDKIVEKLHTHWKPIAIWGGIGALILYSNVIGFFVVGGCLTAYTYLKVKEKVCQKSFMNNEGVKINVR